MGILNLPTELHQHVLSYTSPRDAARYRRVCKSTNRLVVGSERLLLRTFAGGALSRLKKAVDEFNGLETPHDTDSLVEALHVWTKRRGHFDNPVSSLGSVMKLMTHFFLRNESNNQTHDDDGAVTAIHWADIARRFLSMVLYPPGKSAEQAFSDLAEHNLLNDQEMKKLLEYPRERQSQISHHPFSGQLWPEEKLEHVTLPILSWTLTPILRHPKVVSLEPPPAHVPHLPYDEGSLERWINYTNQSHDHDALEQPGLGNEKLVRYLGLPALPNAVSCYYVSDRWAREQIEMLSRRFAKANKRQHKRVIVAPLLRAAILEHVKYF